MLYEPDKDIDHYFGLMAENLDEEHEPRMYAQVAVLWHLDRSLRRIEATVNDVVARLDELEG